MVINPIIFSGLREDSHKAKNASLFDHAYDVYRRGKGVNTPFKIVLQAFEWAKWIPFNQPVISLISQGRAFVKLCRPSNRPLKVFMKGIGVWKRGRGVGKSTVSLGKGIANKGFNRSELSKIAAIAKECFKWTLGFVKWSCDAISLAGNEFLRSIAQTLPDLVSKVGMVSSAPLVSLSVVKQVQDRYHRRRVPKPVSPVLQQARQSTDKVLTYGMLSTVFKLASLCLSGLSLFSVAAIPALIPLSFSTAGLTSSVASLYEGKKRLLENNHICVKV